MKRRRTDIIKGVLGLILCFAAVAGVYYWEIYGRDRIMTAQVVVLRQTLEAGEIVSADNLTVVRHPVEMLIENPVTDISEIDGLVAKHRIPSNMQMEKLSFEESELLPGPEEYIFKMPRDWIESLPSSLRRSDEVLLYPVKRKIGQDVDQENQSDQETPFSNEYFRVAFVKNSANQEVTSVSEGTRLNGSSNVESVEIIAGLDSIEKMTALHAGGYRFIVMYR